MKKLFLVSALAFFGAVSAQEYKPTAGDVTVDFGLNGGLGNTGVSLPEGNKVFKARYFKSEKLAYRAILSIGSTSNTDKSGSTTDPNASPKIDSKVNESATSFVLGLGIEKHFTGTDRLSPYVGGDVTFGYASQSKTRNVVTTATGYSSTLKAEEKGPNTFGLGLRGVFGADYYFAKRVYLGVEAGLAIGYASIGDATISSTSTTVIGTVTNTTSLNSTVKGGSEFTIKPSVITGIRLGYAF